MNPFRIFSIGIDRFEIIVARTKNEALQDHIFRANYNEDQLHRILIYEVSLNTRYTFQVSSGIYEDMTFAQRLKDFVYEHPLVIGYQD